MENTFWLKQSNQPLFPDIAWSRPENRQQAGKLLVIGGNTHGFAAAAQAYNAAMSAGVGAAHVLLPDAIQKAVGPVLEQADFAPSTPSGSFSKKALAELLDRAAWADAVLLAGDLGRNSETAIVLESFASKYSGMLCLTKDAADYFTSSPQGVKDRVQTLFVISLAQLQRLTQSLKMPKPVTFDMGLVQLVEWLHQFSHDWPFTTVVHHAGNLCVAHGGVVTTTKSTLEEDRVWRVTTAAKATVWWLQNPAKPLESITASLFTA